MLKLYKEAMTTISWQVRKTGRGGGASKPKLYGVYSLQIQIYSW